MTVLVNAVASWTIPGVVLTLLVFGVIPDAVLRLLVLAYPPGHPRRQELIAELLAAVPDKERPLWVAKQLLGIVIEGVGSRRTERQTARIERPPVEVEVEPVDVEVDAGAPAVVMNARGELRGAAAAVQGRASVEVGSPTNDDVPWADAP